MVSRCIVQFGFPISTCVETISTHLCLLKEYVYLFTITWMTSARIFILRRGGSMKPLVWLLWFPYKRRGLSFSVVIAEGQVMAREAGVSHRGLVSCGWHSLGVEKSQRTNLVTNP